MKQSKGRMSHQRFVLISILFFHSFNTYMDRAYRFAFVFFIVWLQPAFAGSVQTRQPRRPSRGVYPGCIHDRGDAFDRGGL